MQQNKNAIKTKTKTGVVVSDAMNKTVAVRIERRVLEPNFKKYISRRKKFLAHDEKNECEIGDVVEIQETRPLSRRKSWKVVAIIKKGFGKEIALKE
ncbi:MAG: 30S ribosomal protein S17 [Deltaproteobacteria bacterium]|nr:30S ribosomal protein S17 [Deltaproteobacteria bacterium]